MSTPISFFTNVAGRLLRSELQIDIGHIQLYPTNQYTPAVHRLLQLSANLYDATTNRTDTGYPYLPSVFRPLFTGSSNEVYISGYEEVTNVDLLTATYRDLADPVDRQNLDTQDMIYGVPVIIGAKKGLPNFNEFAMQQDITVSRDLVLRRNPGAPPARTNQVYQMAISNAFGIDLWNSSTNLFPRDVIIHATVQVLTTVTDSAGYPVLGADGGPLTNAALLIYNTNLTTWPGYRSFVSALGFAVAPLWGQQWMPAGAYSFTLNQFTQTTNNPDPANIFLIPRWFLNTTINLECAIVDTTANRLLDLVNISSIEPPINIAAELITGGECASTGQPSVRGDFFCTNRYGGIGLENLPIGLINQFQVSIGAFSLSDATWRGWNAQANDKQASIHGFTQFLQNNYTNLLAGVAPFSPYRTIHQGIVWSANDPLVHYLRSDLLDAFSPAQVTLDEQVLSAPPLADLTSPAPLQAHFRPWGGNPKRSTTDTTPPTARVRGIKDPNIHVNDDWSFPSNLLANLTLLGQVHRGTPWQTLYLKSDHVDKNTWSKWVGLTNASDTLVTLPTNDWRIASLLLALLGTNSPADLRSSNLPDEGSWASALDNLTVFTNGVPPAAQFTMTSGSPQAGTIAQALAAAQKSEGFVADPGDLLGLPQISVASPWLDPTSTLVTDAAYEAIPAQLLPRLRPDSRGVLVGMNPVRLRFYGFDFYSYLVQRSSDLRNWETISMNVPTNGLFEVQDPNAPPAGSVYYRTVLAP